MKRFSCFAITLALFAISLSSCSSDDDNVETQKEQQESNEHNIVRPSSPITLTSQQESINDSLCCYSWKLLQSIYDLNKGGNVVMSPFSINSSLAMILNGMDEGNQAKLEKMMLNAEYSLTDMNEYYNVVSNGIANMDSSTDYSMFSSFWSDKKNVVNDSFMERLKNCYGCEFHPITSTESSSELMKEWVSKCTNGKIASIPEMAGDLRLLNAVSFSSSWAHGFDVKLTDRQNFYQHNGSVKLVDMMHHPVTVGYYKKADGFSLAALPFGNNSFCMFFITPNGDSSLSSVLAQLKGMPRLMKDVESTFNMEIALPKFHQCSSVDILQATGINSLGVKANRIIDGRDAFFSAAYHSADITIDEKGAEAASLSDFHFSTIDINHEIEKQSFVFDHPFIYGIVEMSTSIPVFLGIVENM